MGGISKIKNAKLNKNLSSIKFLPRAKQQFPSPDIQLFPQAGEQSANDANGLLNIKTEFRAHPAMIPYTFGSSEGSSTSAAL
jgi:hypothetical protein